MECGRHCRCSQCFVLYAGCPPVVNITRQVSCRTTFRLTRELEKYGATKSCSADREHIAYVVEGTSLQAAEVTEILLDAVLNQK